MAFGTFHTHIIVVLVNTRNLPHRGTHTRSVTFTSTLYSSLGLSIQISCVTGTITWRSHRELIVPLNQDEVVSIVPNDG